MANRPICPSCGSGNPPPLEVCWKCGAPLLSTTPIQQNPSLPSTNLSPTILVTPTDPATLQTQPTSARVPYKSIYTHSSSDTIRETEETKRKLDTSHTRKGLIILALSYTIIAIIIAATIINPIWGPLDDIADLGAIVGGVLIVIGRDTFGRAHSRNTTLSVLLFLISIGTIIIGKILFGAALALTRIPNGTITYGNETSSTFNPYLILYTTSAIATALTGLAIVFLTYALHRKTGRIILSTSYIAFLTLTILTTALIFQGFATSSSITIDLPALEQVRDQYEIVQLLTVIPNLAFAFTFYLAWSHINRRDIPP